jgi:mannose-1-phosphate guanylyltransferase
MFEERYPAIVAEMRRVVEQDRANPQQPLATSDLYGRLPELDFSRHVLEGAEQSLRVLPVPPCGWSDLGTPKRVAEALRRIERQDERDNPSLDPTACLSLAAQHARLQMAM